MIPESETTMTRPRRMNRFLPAVLLLLITFFAAANGRVAAAAENGNGNGTAKPIRSLGDLNGKRLGVIVGTILDNTVNEVLDFTDISYYDDTETTLEALFAGEIDAYVDDQHVMRYLASRDPRLRLLPDVLMHDNYGFAMRYGEEELYDQVNTALKAIITDGTLKEMESRWLDAKDEAERVIPDLPEQKTGRFLTLGVSPVSAPFVYAKPDGEIVGLDIELMQRLARRINRRLVVVSMDFGSLIASLQVGEVDIIGSSMSITPERRQIIRFTDSYYQGGAAALVLAPDNLPASNDDQK